MKKKEKKKPCKTTTLKYLHCNLTMMMINDELFLCDFCSAIHVESDDYINICDTYMHEVMMTSGQEIQITHLKAKEVSCTLNSNTDSYFILHKSTTALPCGQMLYYMNCNVVL